MNIQCNDKHVNVGSDNLAAVLLELGFTAGCVATAINGEFVPKSLRGSTKVKPGDTIDVVAPMQGG